MVTERICYLYKKNKTILIKARRTPEMALIRLVDNQYEMVKTNILLESLWSEMCQQAQETQNLTASRQMSFQNQSKSRL